MDSDRKGKTTRNLQEMGDIAAELRPADELEESLPTGAVLAQPRLWLRRNYQGALRAPEVVGSNLTPATQRRPDGRFFAF